jgi:hypothetical protein
MPSRTQADIDTGQRPIVLAHDTVSLSQPLHNYDVSVSFQPALTFVNIYAVFEAYHMQL